MLQETWAFFLIFRDTDRSKIVLETFNHAVFFYIYFENYLQYECCILLLGTLVSKSRTEMTIGNMADEVNP